MLNILRIKTGNINIFQEIANMCKKSLANMGKRIPADINNNLRKARSAFFRGYINNAVKFYMIAVEKMMKLLLSRSQYRHHYKDTVEVSGSFKVNISSTKTGNTDVTADRLEEKTRQKDDIETEETGTSESRIEEYYIGDEPLYEIEEEYDCDWNNPSQHTSSTASSVNGVVSKGDGIFLSPTTPTKEVKESASSLTTPTTEGAQSPYSLISSVLEDEENFLFSKSSTPEIESIKSFPEEKSSYFPKDASKAKGIMKTFGELYLRVC